MGELKVSSKVRGYALWSLSNKEISSLMTTFSNGLSKAHYQY